MTAREECTCINPPPGGGRLPMDDCPVHGSRTANAPGPSDVLERLKEFEVYHYLRGPKQERLIYDAIAEIERLMETNRLISLDIHKAWEALEQIAYNDTARGGIEKLKHIQRLEAENARLREAVLRLRTEVNCRIEHGADSGGHLEFVQEQLDAILDGGHHGAD